MWCACKFCVFCYSFDYLCWVQRLFSTIIYQDAPFFDKYSAADLVSCINNDTQAVRSLLVEQIVELLMAVVSAVGGIVSI